MILFIQVHMLNISFNLHHVFAESPERM